METDFVFQEDGTLGSSYDGSSMREEEMDSQSGASGDRTTHDSSLPSYSQLQEELDALRKEKEE